MKNYLSFGGGVNSVAMMLLLLDEGVEFEAVYVDHGCDWPETREYINMLQNIYLPNVGVRSQFINNSAEDAAAFIKIKKYPITILKPQVGGFNNLYEYLFAKGKIPMRFPRWCTVDWKKIPLNKYYQKPAWVNIGYAYDEQHRAQIYSESGYEYRFPLIEREITRNKCKEIIKAHRLPVPIKSGCWFCPFQGVKDYKQLRRKHPDLFCKVIELEKRHIDETWNRHMRCDGATILHKPISQIVDDIQQRWLF